MARLKVLFLTEGKNTPSSRLRVLSFLPYLDKARFEFSVLPVPNSIFKRPGLFRQASRADLVFIQKKLFRPWEIPFLKGRRAMIYDFDDMVMLPGRDRHGRDVKKDAGRIKRFEKTMAEAGLVVAGSRYLQEQTGTARDRTVIIPTTVDAQAQPVKTVRQARENLVVGWIGTRGNLRYLDQVIPVIRRLAGDFPGLTLKIVADGSLEPEGLNTVNKKWLLEDEAQDILTFDLGLMPLTDDPWSRGKCGFKLLQYMAAGLPVVASPVGVNREIVEDGENGFLAGPEDDWADRLGRLLDSPSLRDRLGQAGRRTVEERYDLQAWAGEFARVLETAAG